MGKRHVDEYSALLARAFNGAITVDGYRIVAHPSGTLIVRGDETRRRSALPASHAPDRENDWSDV
jgi:hypothetical protein